MTIEEMKNLIQNGEKIDVEFKDGVAYYKIKK